MLTSASRISKLVEYLFCFRLPRLSGWSRGEDPLNPGSSPTLGPRPSFVVASAAAHQGLLRGRCLELPGICCPVWSLPHGVFQLHPQTDVLKPARTACPKPLFFIHRSREKARSPLHLSVQCPPQPRRALWPLSRPQCPHRLSFCPCCLPHQTEPCYSEHPCSGSGCAPAGPRAPLFLRVLAPGAPTMCQLCASHCRRPWGHTTKGCEPRSPGACTLPRGFRKPGHQGDFTK